MATETYVFKGSKNSSDKTRRIILEGSTTDPKRYLDKDGPAVELTEDEVKKYRSMGYNLVKSGDTGDDDPTEITTEAQQQQAQKPPAGAVGTSTTATGKTAGSK